jgi:hypothetical protein
VLSVVFIGWEAVAQYLGAGAVAGLVGIDGGVVSGVTNLESPGVRAPGRRPRHEEGYHDASAFAFDDRE